MIRNTILAATAAIALGAAGAAVAQPIPVTEIGGSVGTVEGNYTNYGVRAQLGEINFPFSTNLELTFDGNERGTELLGANLVAERQLTDRVGGYLLGGVGYRWANRYEDATWTYGGGLTYALTERTELDLRARTINSFENSRDDTIYSLGVNFKF